MRLGNPLRRGSLVAELLLVFPILVGVLFGTIEFSLLLYTRQQMLDASPLAKAHHRMILPMEVAQAVLYLVSDAAAMVTGTCIAIDGGKSLGVPPR